MAILDEVFLTELSREEGFSSYQLESDTKNFLNHYYVVSTPGTRHLMEKPEVVGYEVYTCLLPATCGMLRHFAAEGKVSSANILSILRGALNYPLEEACYREGILVHDISFLSSERVFHHDEMAGLEIKYSKLATVPDSTLMIGDIVATGETLVHCLSYVLENYKKHGCKLRNIILFTIGGDRTIPVTEELTKQIQSFWPEFEGFEVVFYEGAFKNYEDKGVSGINRPDIDFYWKDSIIAPEYREDVLSQRDVLFEKCMIYDGGARRYEISDHIDEVMEYWTGILERAQVINMKALVDEKLGHHTPISLEDWVKSNHYERIDEEVCRELYEQEQIYLEKIKEVPLKTVASTRITQIEMALGKYMRKK